MAELTHLDKSGAARMVDVGGKPVTAREAVAEGRVRMLPETLQRALSGDSKKGSIRAAAEFAGVMAAKRTAELIPLCHQLPLSFIGVEATIDVDAGTIATGKASIEDVGWEIFHLILEVASGRKKTWSDRWGIFNSLALFNPGPVT